jgi:hypothetical protein
MRVLLAPLIISGISTHWVTICGHSFHQQTEQLKHVSVMCSPYLDPDLNG